VISNYKGFPTRKMPCTGRSAVREWSEDDPRNPLPGPLTEFFYNLVRLVMRLLLTFLFAILPAISSATNDDASYQRYLASIRPQPSRVQYETREVKNGKLIAGFARQDDCESKDTEAVLFVVLQKPDGTIEELGRTPLFDFPACSKVMFEAINFQSDTRFWIQFRHGLNSTEIYQFAFRSGSWLVSGREYNYVKYSDCDEAVGDSRTHWSGNFFTGHTVKEIYQCNKLIEKSKTKVAFPQFPLSSFEPFHSIYGPR
jgi:hypothetical protein